MIKFTKAFDRADQRFVFPVLPMDRLIITPENYHPWLDKSADPDQAFALLDDAAYTDMTTMPVSDWVNNPRHDDDQCVQMF